MSRFAARWTVGALAATVVGVAGVRGIAAGLEIGSRAPAIDVAHWFDAAAGAKPIRGFEPGKVYVVEFWATWCGPCRESIPHLAETQKRFAGKGVTVISVSDEDVPTIEKFLAEKSGDATFGDLTRTYRLATDPDGSVNADYMEAAGQSGIPTAFIVGKKGEIEWIGHPLEMDEPLTQVVAGTWDRVAAAAAMKERSAVEGMFDEISALLDANKSAAALDVVEGFARGAQRAGLGGRHGRRGGGEAGRARRRRGHRRGTEGGRSRAAGGRRARHARPPSGAEGRPRRRGRDAAEGRGARR